MIWEGAFCGCGDGGCLRLGVRRLFLRDKSPVLSHFSFQERRVERPTSNFLHTSKTSMWSNALTAASRVFRDGWGFLTSGGILCCCWTGEGWGKGREQWGRERWTPSTPLLFFFFFFHPPLPPLFPLPSPPAFPVCVCM